MWCRETSRQGDVLSDMVHLFRPRVTLYTTLQMRLLAVTRDHLRTGFTILVVPIVQLQLQRSLVVVIQGQCCYRTFQLH